jgi:hypothetical protein
LSDLIYGLDSAKYGLAITDFALFSL